MASTCWQQHLSRIQQRLRLYPAPDPLPRTRPFWLATGLVTLAVLAFSIFFISYLTGLQDAYLTHAEDLGNMDQAIWSTLHGQLLRQTICNPIGDTNCAGPGGISRFALHVEPILFLALLLLYILGSALRAAYFHGNMPFSQGFQWPQTSTHTALAQSFLGRIPSTASISAQSALVPHLSHRTHIYLFPYAATTADYVLLDVTSDIYPFYSSSDYIRTVKQLLLNSTHDIVAAQDGYILLKLALAAPGLSSSPIAPTNGTCSKQQSEQHANNQSHKRFFQHWRFLLSFCQIHCTLHCTVGTGIKRVVSSGCGTLLLSDPVSTTTSSPLKDNAKRSRLRGAGPSRYSPSPL